MTNAKRNLVAAACRQWPKGHGGRSLWSPRLAVANQDSIAFTALRLAASRGCKTRDDALAAQRDVIDTYRELTDGMWFLADIHVDPLAVAGVFYACDLED